MPKLLLIWPWMLTAALAAQQGSAPDLPRLDRLDPSAIVTAMLKVCGDWGVNAVGVAAALSSRPTYRPVRLRQ